MTAERAQSPHDVRLIAFYLPQFHPIPENDLWWETGFTEWTNVTKSRPLYPGHYQPKLPADLGFYDLRVPETRQKQADLASRYGIEAFCYWHYWFGNGKRLLEKPFDDVLGSGQPRFPFCLAWANHDWTKKDGKGPERILIEQTYPGMEDHIRHFHSLEKAFHDTRYVCVDGKPLFCIFEPDRIPQIERFIECWLKLARKSGLPGIYWVAYLNHPTSQSEVYIKKGFSATVLNLHFVIYDVIYKMNTPLWARLLRKVRRSTPVIFSYRAFIENPVFKRPLPNHQHALILPNWDDTPRRSNGGFVLHGSNPETFRQHVRDVLQTTLNKPRERRLVFIRSWNEWAEGNYLEPDRQFGRRYLEILEEALNLIRVPNDG